MKTILAAGALAISAAQAADAAVYRYEYQGRPIMCDEYCEWSTKNGEWVQRGDEWVFEGTVNITYEGTFTGLLVIDEALFPGGSLSNAVLEVSYSGAGPHWQTGEYQPSRQGFSVTTPTSAFSGWWNYDSGSLANIGIIEAGWQFFWSSIDYQAQALLEFDADGNIKRWAGYSLEGGSSDPSSDMYNDGFASGAASSGPGKWTRTEVTESVPAPVPLPASALLMLTGMAGIGATRLRRR